MVAGQKTIETRSWFPYRLKRGEWVAIHAGKGFDSIGGEFAYCELCVSEPFKTALNDAFQRGIITSHTGDGHLYPADLPRGAVVAVARFVEARQTQHITGISAEERAFGNYAHGRWGWIFEQVQPVTPPIPASGKLFVWDWTPPAGFALGGAAPAADAPVTRSLWEE